MSEEAPVKKERIRAALDVLQNYVGLDGKIDATKLTQEIKHLRQENEALRKDAERWRNCCTQRGARMQILHDAVMSAYNYETSGPLWEAIVRAKDWFNDIDD